MAAVKTLGGTPPARSAAGNQAHKRGSRNVPHRRLHLEPGHSALTEKAGENRGRASQRGMTSTQYRLSRVREFNAGAGSK